MNPINKRIFRIIKYEQFSFSSSTIDIDCIALEEILDDFSTPIYYSFSESVIV